MTNEMMVLMMLKALALTSMALLLLILLFQAVREIATMMWKAWIGHRQKTQAQQKSLELQKKRKP